MYCRFNKYLIEGFYGHCYNFPMGKLDIKLVYLIVLTLGMIMHIKIVL